MIAPSLMQVEAISLTLETLFGKQVCLEISCQERHVDALNWLLQNKIASWLCEASPPWEAPTAEPEARHPPADRPPRCLRQPPTCCLGLPSPVKTLKTRAPDATLSRPADCSMVCAALRSGQPAVCDSRGRPPAESPSRGPCRGGRAAAQRSRDQPSPLSSAALHSGALATFFFPSQAPLLLVRRRHPPRNRGSS